jgi:hypothetical protein
VAIIVNTETALAELAKKIAKYLGIIQRFFKGISMADIFNDIGMY